MASPEYQRLPYLRNIAFTVSCFLFLAGCAAKRDGYHVPAPDLPEQYAKAPSATDKGNPENAPAYTPASSFPLDAALVEWWRLLGSQELNGLMDRALANNPDLRIAVLRIAQSKARLDQAGADKAPAITMPAQVKNEYPESGIGRGNASGKNKSRTTHQISVRGDWRPDIWGETYSLYESAEMQLLRAIYQRDDMQRTVVANMVAGYMEYLSLNDRLRVARETEKSLGEMLASVNARLEAGDATVTEMEQQKAAVYSVKATIPVLEQQREVALNRLASLAGSAPVALKLSDSGLDSAKFPPVLPGVPSALLLRRPDVRAAEARLLAADADIDVARARVLPPLDLTAQAGYGSMYMSGLFTPQSLFWSAIANLSATIFDSGKRAREVEFSEAVHEELVETYVRVVYDAVREVDDSLSAIDLMGKRLEAQGVAADASLLAWNFSQEAFMAGAVDYLVVLDTQRTYQRNLDDWYNVRMERYRGLVNLFSALGGGVAPGGDTRDRDAMPGEGALQKAGKATAQDRAGGVPSLVDLAANARVGRESRALAQRIDWAGNLLQDSAWLVELSGVYDRSAVLPAWRDLNARFAREAGSLVLFPQRQGQVNAAGKERASWYRLFAGIFTGKKMAEEFCAALRAGHQRCGVVSRQSLAGKGDFVAPPPQPGSLAADAGWAAVQPATAQPGQQVGQQPGQATAETIRAQPGQDTEAVAVAETARAGTSREAEAPAEERATPEITQPAEIMRQAEAVSAPDTPPEALVERWMKDWSEKNVEGYLSRYDTSFQPAGRKGREAWEAKRRRRIGEAASIRVRAENLKIQRGGELMATARFVEILEVGNYKKISRKELSLIRYDRHGEWKIRGEKEVTMAEAARAEAQQDAVAALAADQQGKAFFDGMNWSGRQFWLAELPDVHDRDAVAAAWRELRARFNDQMKGRTVHPRRQSRGGDTAEGHASRYQLFIAKFPEKKLADEFCAMLRARQQRCGVASSQSFAGKDDLKPED